ncbi:MAG: energy-coupled thiamine transporter ThiT [Clostridiales bacterium]|nr:energy-coupled thiamine transporter ThiT [Clostridiales bacterium]
MKTISRENKTQRLALSGLLIALAVILSLIKILQLPYGGSITLFGMVPVMLLGYMYGVGWGLLSGFVFGIIRAILGVTVSSALAGQSVWGAIGVIALDYLVAFTVLGTAGIFRKTIKNPIVSFPLGCVVASLLRLAAHFFSGLILFGQWAEWYFTQENFPAFGQTILEKYSGWGLSAIYSIIYNASFMIPELILSVIAAVILMSVKPIRKICAE